MGGHLASSEARHGRSQSANVQRTAIGSCPSPPAPGWPLDDAAVRRVDSAMRHGAEAGLRAAAAAISVRLVMPSLVRQCETWVLTVARLMTSRSAICGFVRPSATRSTTASFGGCEGVPASRMGADARRCRGGRRRVPRRSTSTCPASRSSSICSSVSSLWAAARASSRPGLLIAEAEPDAGLDARPRRRRAGGRPAGGRRIVTRRRRRARAGPGGSSIQTWSDSRLIASVTSAAGVEHLVVVEGEHGAA